MAGAARQISRHKKEQQVSLVSLGDILDAKASLIVKIRIFAAL